MKRIISFVMLVSLLNAFKSVAQSTQATNIQNAKEANTIATGNFRDAFNGFFQLALDKVTSDQKELNFTSNPYAVMARINPDLFVDTNYYHYRYLRRFNFSVVGKLDDKYKFNGFSSGINYALINRRDETISKAFISDVVKDTVTIELVKLNNAITSFFSTLTQKESIELNTELIAFSKGGKNFSDLNIKLKSEMKRIIKNNNLTMLDYAINNDKDFNINKITTGIYNTIKKSYNNKLLWTVGIADTTYNDQFMFSNIVLSTQILKGVIKPQSSINLELNLLSNLQFTDDSMKTGRDLAEAIWNIEPGLNFVLKEKSLGASFLEFKLSGSIIHNFNKSILSKDKNNLNINGTLRLRIIKDIWIPIEIKYDTKTGNFLGFLNIRANFSSLKELL